MNALPSPFDKRDSRATKAIEGVKAHGDAIGVKQNSEPVLTKALKDVRHRESAFQASFVKRQRELTPALNKADADAVKFFSDAKKILKMFLGEKWTPQWAEAGFVNGTIQTPGFQAERESLLLSLAAYFTANRHREVPALLVTAARAQEIHTALSAARSARDAHDLAHQKLCDHRKDANATLRKRMNGLLGELNTLLERDDARWAAFGFVPPARRKRKAKASADAGQQPVAVALKAAA